MTLIDQRIVIDAPPHIIWDYISDPEKLRRWHTGYRKISVLTTQQIGLGTRRRCELADSDKDVIEEITAWVDGLGYEYTQIEGGLFKMLRARFRLQAGPDGTIVQWTVTYQPRGIAGRLRDLFGGKRDMQVMMAESLRTLRRQVDELGLRMDADYRERVSMRDRLNHTERQRYRARLEDSADMPAPGPGGAVHVAEPSSRPPIAPTTDPTVRYAPPAARETETPPPPEHIVPPSPGAVPSFVNDLLTETGSAGADTDYEHTADTEPKPPEGLREALAEQEIVEPADAPAPDDEDAAEPESAPDDTAREQAQFARPQEPPAAQEAPAATSERAAPVVPPVYDAGPAPDKRTTSREMDSITPEVESAPEPVPEADQPPEPALLAPGPVSSSAPTPPHGIPSVRSQATMTPVEPDATAPESAPQEAPPQAPFSSSAPTPPRGIPSVNRTQADARNELARQRANLPPPTPKTDTGEISIWEVFRETRPSEQDANALQDLIESVSAKEAAQVRRRTRWAKRPPRVRHMQRRVGLRLRLSLSTVQVRVRRALRPENTGKRQTRT